jgi:hypothetical protein
LGDIQPPSMFLPSTPTNHALKIIKPNHFISFSY